MCKEEGVPHIPMSVEARKARGLAVWEDGEVFRPGKTRRDHESGAWQNRISNRDERREVNRSGGRPMQRGKK